MTARLFIDGQWVAPVSGETFDVIDPGKGKPFAEVARAGAADVDLAVKAARRAFDEGPWPKLSFAERGAVLRKMAALISDRIDELAELEVRDNGKPLPEARWDIEDVVGCFEYYADMAEGFASEQSQPVSVGADDFTSRVRKEPLGVVGAIVPWNFPMLMAAWKVAPALAAGCTVVLKPSEVTPMTALVYGEIAEAAGLPAGALNILTGFGPEVGAPLSEHPLVDKVAFTGSVPTGSKIMQAAAQDVKTISLELGGKSPFIVFADSDLEAAVEWIMFGIFWNQGEVCSATSRVLVEREMYEPLLERLSAECAKLKIGYGMDEDVLLGAIVNEAQHRKILAAIESGKESGARLVCGGKAPAHLSEGYYLEATIFADVPTDASIWKEEIFGPVVCINPFDSEAEALREANDSEFGLGAAVMSKDLERCDRVAEGLRAGIVWINCSQPTFIEVPWGGYKRSGIGRELGRWGFEAYLETKQITSYHGGPWGWYIKG
ncbi:aldehyde dehydrogenase family protein [Marinobacterium lutimaris]|uniref:Betaine-aldehyde dehydrogenase n=1 Tax=Marinobacterium lutimaris TaxID=568106 RepID=A0A1H6DQA6_9GAMM|nr:aldehyde dehydrogenase family protein [Marinobacterium lutimaris]SEG87542.1 betaine-aldehyde dehydrogenase [Marinobacterium lutimaris]